MENSINYDNFLYEVIGNVEEIDEIEYKEKMIVSYKDSSDYFRPNQYTIYINDKPLTLVNHKFNVLNAVEWIKKNIPDNICNPESFINFINKNRSLKMQFNKFRF